MALFRGIQEYIALDANNITLVFDSGNIVNISGNIFLYPPQGHPILYKYSATLIDNIFSNNLYERISNGLLINDLSDHLPVFSITKEIQKAVNKTRYMFKRNTTPDTISLFVMI